MFQIGEFSRIAQVSGHLLRHYDDVGLFKPAQVDEWTGYRYYSAAQLPRLNRILALRDLGLSLDQVRQIVADDISGDDIRELLVRRKTQIESTLHEERTRLRHVEGRLEQIDSEGALDDAGIIVKSMPAQPFLSMDYTLPSFDEGPQFVHDVTRAVECVVDKKHMQHFAAVFHYDLFVTENIKMEAGFVLSKPLDVEATFASGQSLTLGTLPKVQQVASMVQHEVHHILYRTYGTLGTWIEQNGYEFAGPVRKLYLTPPEPSEGDKALVEIQFPIQPAKSSSLLV